MLLPWNAPMTKRILSDYRAGMAIRIEKTTTSYKSRPNSHQTGCRVEPRSADLWQSAPISLLHKIAKMWWPSFISPRIFVCFATGVTFFKTPGGREADLR
jgi:hypothetical protein